jgi:ribosomal protein S15P/S13E
VDKFLELLSSLVPAWIAFLTIAFGYLVYLFRRASKEFISLSEKQSEYLKDRVEVVDKATTIFTRTIGQQEKEIANLTDRLKKLDSHVDESRSIAAEKSIEEIKTFEATIRNIAKMQELTLEFVSRSKPTDKDTLSQLEISKLREQIDTNLEEDIPRAIRSRDLSLYPVKTANCKGARELVRKLKANGFTASIYLGITGEDEEEQDLPDEAWPHEEHHAIWVGARVPTKVAVQIIFVAAEHWPFLRYVHISTDSDQGPPDSVHSLMYLGGSTDTATARYRLVPWTAENFRQLRENMSQSEFHTYIRRFYPQLASPLP